MAAVNFTRTLLVAPNTVLIVGALGAALVVATGVAEVLLAEAALVPTVLVAVTEQV